MAEPIIPICELNLNTPLAYSSSTRSYKPNPWFWIDLETTGIHPHNSLILEIAIIATDHFMNTIDSMHIIIHHDLDTMMRTSTAWCKNKFCSITMGGNGLFDECVSKGLTYEDAQYYLKSFFHKHCANPETETSSNVFVGNIHGVNAQRRYQQQPTYLPTITKTLLCGSSVHFDKLFLSLHFPSISKYIHHRVIDVSSSLEMMRKWRPDLLYLLPKPNGSHRAKSDILDSIELMRFIQKQVFKK